MKVIRISDTVHAQLKKEAASEGRTLQWLVEYKLTGGVTPKIYASTPEKIASEPSAKVSDLFQDEPMRHPADVPARDKGDIIADIREAEAARDEELRYCQDPGESKKIADRWNEKITALWEEYKDTEYRDAEHKDAG